VIVHRGDEEKTQELLRPFGFSAVTFQGMTGTAAENIRSLERELEANKKTQDDAAAAIAASAEKPGALRIYADRLRAEAAKEQCAESARTDEKVLYFFSAAPARRGSPPPWGSAVSKRSPFSSGENAQPLGSSGECTGMPYLHPVQAVSASSSSSSSL